MFNYTQLKFIANEVESNKRFRLSYPIKEIQLDQIIFIFGRLYLVSEWDKKYYLKPLDGGISFEESVQWLLTAKDWTQAWKALDITLNTVVYTDVQYIRYNLMDLTKIMYYFSKKENLLLAVKESKAIEDTVTVDNTVEQ